MNKSKIKLIPNIPVNPEVDYVQSFEFLENVINSSPNLIFVKDIKGRFTLANTAVAEIYGTSVEDLIGKTDADFNNNPDEVDWYCHDDQEVILNHKTVFIPEEKVSSPDGTTRWFETTKKPILTWNGEYQVLGVATEITDRKKLFEQLLQAQKMQSLGRLAGGIAHDFNNLLTVILGHVSILEESNYDPVQTKKAVAGIKNTSLKAADLVKKILGFAREGKHLNVEIDLHQLVNETIALLSRTIEENIKITTDLKAENFRIKGDPIQIQQVLMNLIINARDAMNSEISGVNGGLLQISSENKISNEINKVVIKVKDTGCGMDETTKARIFDPFFTTKSSGHGLGLGLSMAYGIIDNHQGSIEIDSTLGKGTTFTIKLPLIQDTIYKSNEQQSTRLEERSLHVLVVDDNIHLLKNTAEILRSLNHQVTFTSSPEEALNCLASKASQIDLLILDAVMPNLNPVTFIKSARQLDPKLKVILSSSYDLTVKSKDYEALDVKYFLHKPYDRIMLIETLKKILT